MLRYLLKRKGSNTSTNLLAGERSVNALENLNKIEAISLGFFLINCAKDKAIVLPPLKQVRAEALDYSHVQVP